MKKIIILLLIIFFSNLFVQPTQAFVDPISVSAETYALVILAGKVYAISSKVISASGAMAAREATKEISKESEENMQGFIDAMGERAAAAASEAYAAKTEEEARQALNKEAQFREMQRKYSQLLYAARDNTAIVVKEIALDEAQSQAVGYVTGMAKGEVGTWAADTALGAVGQELTEEGVEFTGAIINLTDGAMNGVSQFENGLDGKIPTDISPEDAQFMQALMDVKGNSMEAAISKAEWDKFVKETAKEEFKEYLKGNSGNFTNLPLSVQERYWGKFLTMTPDDFDHVNRIMTGARYTNDYASALKRIMSEYPHYAEFFKNLNKDKLDADQALKEEIEEFLEQLNASPTPTPSTSPSPDSSPQMQLKHRQITGRGSWGGNSYTITFHSSGGHVSGSFGGKCSGGVSGSFDGGDRGRIRGSISGSCKVDDKGSRVPGSGSFSGTVYLTKGYASGRWGGSAGGVNQGGGWSISFTPLEYETVGVESGE